MDNDVWGFILLILFLIGLPTYLAIHYHNEVKRDNELIGEANDRIVSLDEQIWTAKDQAWSDYDSMGTALDGLETEFIVSTSTGS